MLRFCRVLNVVFIFAVKVLDGPVDNRGQRLLPYDQVATTHFPTPVSLLLVPGFGMLVVQRTPSAITRLSSITVGGVSDGPSLPRPPWLVGEVNAVRMAVAGATDGVVYRWMKGSITLYEGDSPTVNYTIQPEDSGTVVLQGTATHALGSVALSYAMLVADVDDTASSSSGSSPGPPSAPQRDTRLSVWTIVGAGIAAGVVVTTLVAIFAARAVRRRLAHIRKLGFTGTGTSSVVVVPSHPSLDRLTNIVTEQGTGRTLPSRRLQSESSPTEVRCSFVACECFMKMTP